MLHAIEGRAETNELFPAATDEVGGPIRISSRHNNFLVFLPKLYSERTL